MNPHFNKEKATEAAGKLLQLAGGNLNYMKLLKLLYLADRRAITQWGRAITTDCYVFMNREPVLSQTYDLIIEGDDPREASTIWSSFITEPKNYNVALKKEIEFEELSRAEINLIEEIYNEFGIYTQWELVDITHKLPEWRDPKGSAIPFGIREILQADGFQEDHIVAIESELIASNAADQFFRAY